MAAPDESDGGSNTRWEGYSDYQLVSSRIAGSIDDAVEAYAVLDARHREGARVNQQLAAEVRAAITTAAIQVQDEMRTDRDTEAIYEEILSRWEGEDGFLSRFDAVHLVTENPDWLKTFVRDIRRAGWHLGYLQAGRETRVQQGDPVDRQVNTMFEG